MKQNYIIPDYTWSYKKDSVPLSVKVEHVLKYGELYEINDMIESYGHNYCKKIWIDKIISDKRFYRLNYFLARFIFNISTNKEEIFEFIRSNKKDRFNLNRTDSLKSEN